MEGMEKTGVLFLENPSRDAHLASLVQKKRTLLFSMSSTVKGSW
jgi:hypothetical protein